MKCKKCKENPCTEQPPCTCAVKDLSTDCSLYTGEDLPNSGIKKNTILTEVIRRLDTFIVNKFNEAIKYLTLKNVGDGAKVYKGIDGVGNKLLRSIKSNDITLLKVEEGTDTVDIKPGEPVLEFGDDILTLTVITDGESTVKSTVDLSGYANGSDTFVQSASFNTATNILTLTRNNGQPSLTVDLSYLDNPGTDTNTYVTAGSYNTGTSNLTLTRSDSTTVTISLSALITQILNSAASAQVQANVLETNNTSKAFIQNKNATKTVTLGSGGTYNVTNADNTYTIEIDNGANNVTINFATVTLTDNYFVGFVIKGTGTVTFTGYDIKPSGYEAESLGQGHPAALEIINSTKYLHGTLVKTP